jgi:hypothetical protein
MTISRQLMSIAVMATLLLGANVGCGDATLTEATVTPPVIPIDTTSKPIVTGPDEPVYDASVHKLVMKDDMDSYTTAAQMGANPVGTAPRIVPIPAPVTTSSPVSNKNDVIVGRNGTGKAARLLYTGIYQDGANLETMNTVRQPATATHYFQYWARVNLSLPFAGTIAVKWFEAWHAAFDRVQWNTHDHLPCPTSSRSTYFQVYDQSRETTCQGNQPIGPYFSDIADNKWHRYTYSYKPNTAKGSRDGFARMWIDGVKMIDVSAATIGVTPPGGEKPWCLANDVDALANGDGIVSLRWGSTQTTTSPSWTYDIDDVMWWSK